MNLNLGIRLAEENVQFCIWLIFDVFLKMIIHFPNNYFQPKILGTVHQLHYLIKFKIAF